MKGIIITAVLILLFSVNVKADSIDNFDFGNLEDTVENEADISINKLLKNINEGEGVVDVLKDRLIYIFKNNIFYNNSTLKAIILISIASAIINIVADDIKDKSVAQLVALIGQIMIIGVATISFKNSINVLKSSIESVTNVVNSSAPFIIMLMSATGNVSAVGGGGILAIGAEIVGKAIDTFIIPFLVISTALRVINILSKKQLVDKLSTLFMTGTQFALKACAYIFVFIVSVEKLSGGAINKSLGGTLKNAVKMIPVIGDVVGGASDMALNALGGVCSGFTVVIVIALVIVSFAPVVEIGIVALMLKLISAVLEPICDKQTIDIIDAVGDGNLLILSALFIISLMFVVSCAIVLGGVTWGGNR